MGGVVSVDPGSTPFILPSCDYAGRNDMDYDIVLLMVVCLSCLAGLVVMWTRVRLAAPGWAVVYLTILVPCFAGWFWEQSAVFYGAVAMWFLLVLLPGVVGKLCQRRMMQERYADARRLAQIYSWLHPADGWREQPKIIHALELAQQGDLTAAEALQRFQDVNTLVGLAAVANLYRIMNQWEELLVWHARHRQEIERYPQFLPVMLRARGETGDLRGLIELFDQQRRQIGKLVPATSRTCAALCSLHFAASGRRQRALRRKSGHYACSHAGILARYG